MEYSVLAVILTGALGTLALLFEAMRYLKEGFRLKKARKAAAEQLGSLDDLCDSLSTQIPASSFVADRLDTVQRLHAAGGRVSLSELSELSREDAETGWNFRLAKSAMSCLLILGICLTFHGLTTALRSSGLGEDGVVSAQQVNSVLRVLKLGFQNAFATSTNAIGWTIGCLCLQIVIVSPARDRFFHALDRFTQLSIFPLLAEKEPDSPAQVVLAGVAAKMDAVCVELRTSSQSLASALASAAGASVSLAGFGKQFGEVIEAFNKAIGRNSQFANSVTELEKLVSRSDKRHEDLMKAIDLAMLRIQEQNVAMAEQQSSLGEFQAQVKRSEVSLRTSVGEFLKAGSDMTAQFHVQTSQRVEQAVEALTDALSVLRMEMEQRASEAARGLEELQGVRDECHGTTQEVEQIAGRLAVFLPTLEENAAVLRELLSRWPANWLDELALMVSSPTGPVPLQEISQLDGREAGPASAKRTAETEGGPWRPSRPPAPLHDESVWQRSAGEMASAPPPLPAKRRKSNHV